MQHHVMEERMAPQLWQGSVAQRVGVVSLRFAWSFVVLHRGHSKWYVVGGVVCVVVGVVSWCCWMVCPGCVRRLLLGCHCGVPLRLGVPGLSWRVPARSLARVLGVMVVRRQTRASWTAMCSLVVRHMFAAMQGTWRGMARWRSRMLGCLDKRKRGRSCGVR